MGFTLPFIERNFTQEAVKGLNFLPSFSDGTARPMPTFSAHSPFLLFLSQGQGQGPLSQFIMMTCSAKIVLLSILISTTLGVALLAAQKMEGTKQRLI